MSGLFEDIEHLMHTLASRHPSFHQSYRCVSASATQKENVEQGDKIIMPQSALNCLAYLNIEYPMMFELRYPNSGRFTHCSVLEFTAEEGMVVLPQWMMNHMQLEEGDIIQMKNTTLPKGTYVKLQPHTKDFIDISNPRAVLEKALRSFSCLTTGDTIMISYNKKKFYINVVETKPASAISIVETDCEVDFAAPLDYVEPEAIKPSPPNVEEEGPESKKLKQSCPFTGPGRRLDGKPSVFSSPAASVSDPLPKKEQQEASSSNVSRHHSGRLVFGSSSAGQSSSRPITAVKETKSEEQSSIAEAPKFQTFTGKKYTLK